MSYYNPRQINISTALWLIYTLFIIYGTTIPFNFCIDIQVLSQNFSQISWTPFVDPDGSRASIPDIVQNILLFLPFGFLGFFSTGRKGRTAIFVVTLLGFLLSAVVETLQLFFSDRTTSMSDIVTNSVGSFAGAFAGSNLIGLFESFFRRPSVKQYHHIRFIYPLVICCVLVVLGALHPFDFTLDVGSVWAKIRSIIINPLRFDSILRDEGIYFMRFFLFGLLWSLCLWEWGWKNTILKGILISCAAGIFLESCQIIVSSRMPTAQDILVIMGGSLCGGLFIGYWPFLFNDRLWSVIIVFATSISAIIFSLSPFQFVMQERTMNWVPFLPYYEITTFVALSNFIESMLIYFPMGFILQYFSKERPAYLKSLFIAFVICFPLEYSQQWIAGRYADITDVFGALAGALTGVVMCRSGWAVFLSYIKETDCH